MRLPNIPHRHIGDHVYTERVTRRALVVIAAVVLTIVLIATIASIAAAHPRRAPLPVPTHTSSSVRCTVLEHYRTGNVLGCTDGEIRFEPRGRARG